LNKNVAVMVVEVVLIAEISVAETVIVVVEIVVEIAVEGINKEN
jgi:hypothetical protein